MTKDELGDAEASLIEGLVTAVASALILLETSSDDEVDPHVAVRGMEDIASSLLAMTPNAQQRFLTELERLANGSDLDSWSKFLRGIPYMTGLVEQ